MTKFTRGNETWVVWTVDDNEPYPTLADQVRIATQHFPQVPFENIRIYGLVRDGKPVVHMSRQPDPRWPPTPKHIGEE